MINTQKIRQAIKFAIKTHEVYEKQKRKGKDIPYITHPLTAGLLLASVGANEDTVIAGILHDTIEDSIPEKKVTAEMLEQRFGKKVAELVLSVTEQNKELSWEERKAEALEHIKAFSHDSLLIKSSDVVSNASELIDDYEKFGDETFKRFNAPKEVLIQHQLMLIARIIEAWNSNPLSDDLIFLARQLQMINAGDFILKKPAKIIEYKDYTEDMPVECSVCGWKGTPKSSGGANFDSEVCLSVDCPICDKMLIVAGYPLND